MEEAVLERQIVGLPLTVEVGLCETEEEKLLLSVPDTLTLEEGDCETLSVPLVVGLELCERDGETVEQELGLVLTEALAQCEAEEQ